MAKSYTSTININCWKEHTCISCQSLFAYNFKRKVARKARSAEKATANAQAAVQKTLKNDVDFQPCPACGIYQPDMIGQKRHKQYTLVLWLALIAFVVLMVLRFCDVLQTNAATWILVAIAAMAAIWTFLVNWKNPNADPLANQRLANERISAGTLQQRSGTTTGAALEWVNPPRSPVQMLAGPLLLVGILLIAAAELLRMAHGWPMNDFAYPPVVGPGDGTRLYMSGKIDSIKGYWRGDPKCTLTLADGHSVDVPATANQNDWGQTIEDVKSDEEHSSATPWVELQLPNDPSLANQVADCHVVLNLEYPQYTGPGNFKTVDDKMSQQWTLHLAPAGAGTQYNTIWWVGTFVGAILILATDLLLMIGARNLKSAATPTRILSPAPAA
jgi:hypothetical protein